MNLVVAHWLPGKLDKDGTREPAQPCPDLLTADEAVRFLRLDESSSANPDKALRYYRDKGLLRGVRMGNSVRFRLADLLALIESEEQAA